MEARLLQAIMLRNACIRFQEEERNILARFALRKGHRWGGHAHGDIKQPEVEGECIGPVSGPVSMSTKDIIKVGIVTYLAPLYHKRL